MDKAKVFKHIEGHVQDHVAKIRELIRQPSVSGENYGVRECAELVRSYLEDLGCKDAKLAETSGHPVVFGKYDAGARRTILVYSMYDVQPADEPGWSVPPFEGVIKDVDPFGKCIVGRGAINTKGPLRAFLNALESIKATGQEIPVNLIFAIEGEEELGSRHLPEFVQSYKEELRKADLVFFPFADMNRNGKVVMHLGVKGIVYFELELSGKDWGYGPTEFGIHGSNKSWVDSPVWRMIQALSTMTSKDGNMVAIEGFYDKVRPPNQEEEELVRKLAETFDEQSVKEQMRVERFIEDSHGVDALRRYLFTPTLNINGIWAGYTGPATKTLLPHKITVKMDVRLVPNMRKDDVIPMIRKHLDKHGFKEIRINVVEHGYDWSQMSVKHPAVQSVIKVYKDFGHEPEVWPRLAGSAPFALFTKEPLNLPFVHAGLGHGGLAHSPNEYLVIQEGRVAGLASLEKSYAAFIDEFSRIA